MSTPSTSEATQKKMEESRAQRKQQHDDDMRTILSLPVGRRILARIIFDTCRLMEGSYCGDKTHDSAMLEGKRAVGAFLMGEAWRVDEHAFALLQQEAFASWSATDMQKKLADERAQK